MKTTVLTLAGVLLTTGVIAAFSGKVDASAATKRTISQSTLPCNASYKKLPSYNKKTKNYYTIKSYLEKISKAGGGTLVLKKGTYKICSTLTIPSNVTIQLKKGVKLKKTDDTGSDELQASNTMFQLSKKKAKQYKGYKKITIKASGTATIDLGKIEKAVAINLAHNSDVTISGITFTGKNGGTYIQLGASKNIKIKGCSFKEGVVNESDKNKCAIAINSIDKTVPDTILITENKFTGLQSGIATVKYIKNLYANQVSITKNTFTTMSNTAIVGKMWKNANIIENSIKRKDGVASTLYGIALYSVLEPTVTSNEIADCTYPIYMSRSASVSSILSDEAIARMENNKVSNVLHYYVPFKNGIDSRLLYFKSLEDKEFTLNPASEPYHERYTDSVDYTANNSEARTYFMLRSYMEQLEYTGGGTITLLPGEYVISHSVCIPSNVTLKLSDGVLLRKVKATNTEIGTHKTMLELVPPSLEKTQATLSGYNGSQNVTIEGTGSAIIDCAFVTNAMGVVLGHSQNVNIRGIAFINEYGSHFIELNSSKNVTVENCSFTDFKIYDNKSHKEAINIDSTDTNNNGFNYEWSSHDRTTCDTVMIQNCIFTNMGVAVGSHTYSTLDNNQLYHENITFQNNKVNATFNAGIRMLNWRNAVIKNNMFVGIQGLDDNKDSTYTCILVKGAVNPTITGNTFNRGGTKSYYAVVIYEKTEPAVTGAINAGYPATYCEISEQNRADLRKNTVGENCYQRFLTKKEDGSNDLYVINANGKKVKNPDTLFEGADEGGTEIPEPEVPDLPEEPVDSE